MQSNSCNWLYTKDNQERHIQVPEFDFIRHCNKISSSKLPPDIHSAMQDVKSVHHQSFLWFRFKDNDVPYLDPVNYGWQKSVESSQYLPLWFECFRLPPKPYSELLSRKAG